MTCRGREAGRRVYERSWPFLPSSLLSLPLPFLPTFFPPALQPPVAKGHRGQWGKLMRDVV